MICKEFIELARLMKEHGIEVEEKFWSNEYQKFMPKPDIESILTVAFGERVWGSGNEGYSSIGKISTRRYQNIQFLNRWDDEQNNPLHECPKLCLWLIGEIKNLK